MKKMFAQSSLGLRFLQGIVLFVFAVGAVSCQDASEVLPETEPEVAELDLYQALGAYNSSAAGEASDAQRVKGPKKPTFKTLTVALAKTGLMGTVASTELTLFAPTDEAFAALGLNQRNITEVENLREILLYHAVAGKVYASDLMNGYVPTLNGAAVEIDLSSGVMVNDAQVFIADIKARNGVIHAIDQVLFPPMLNLVELALSLDPEFSILVAAVQKAGLVEALAEGGPYTVFAPTNQAFVELLGELGFASLDEIPTDVLTKVLLYHVVEGRVYSSDLSSGPVKTLGGESFIVNTANLTLTDVYGREADLVPSGLNVQATNGVVHVIDQVILPDLGL